jgi:hypothetical protein
MVIEQSGPRHHMSGFSRKDRGRSFKLDLIFKLVVYCLELQPLVRPLVVEYFIFFCVGPSKGKFQSNLFDNPLYVH